MDMSRTLLRIRGFGDISLHGDTQKGDTTTFSLGQLDLFVTSDLSERFKFLSEIVFEGGPDNLYGSTVGEENSFSVDLERYLLQYSADPAWCTSAGIHEARLLFRVRNRQRNGKCDQLSAYESKCVLIRTHSR